MLGRLLLNKLRRACRNARGVRGAWHRTTLGTARPKPLVLRNPLLARAVSYSARKGSNADTGSPRWNVRLRVLAQTAPGAPCAALERACPIDAALALSY